MNTVTEMCRKKISSTVFRAVVLLSLSSPCAAQDRSDYKGGAPPTNGDRCSKTYNVNWKDSDTKGWVGWKVNPNLKPFVQDCFLVSKGGWPVDLGHLGGPTRNADGTIAYPGACNEVKAYGIGPFAQVVYRAEVSPCLDLRGATIKIRMKLSKDFKWPDPNSRLRLWLVMRDDQRKRSVNYEFLRNVLKPQDAPRDGREFTVRLRLDSEFKDWRCFGANSDYNEYRSVCRPQEAQPWGYGCAETNEQFLNYLAHTNEHLGFVFTLPQKPPTGSWVHQQLVGAGSIHIREIRISGAR